LSGSNAVFRYTNLLVPFDALLLDAHGSSHPGGEQLHVSQSAVRHNAESLRMRWRSLARKHGNQRLRDRTGRRAAPGVAHWLAQCATSAAARNRFISAPATGNSCFYAPEYFEALRLHRLLRGGCVWSPPKVRFKVEKLPLDELPVDEGPPGEPVMPSFTVRVEQPEAKRHGVRQSFRMIGRRL